MIIGVVKSINTSNQKMKKIIKLTESDLVKIVKRVISEETITDEASQMKLYNLVMELLRNSWQKIGTGDYRKPMGNYNNIAKNVKLGQNKGEWGDFLYRKKFRKPGSKEEIYCEMYVTNDLKNVVFNFNGKTISYGFNESSDKIFSIVEFGIH